MRCHSRVVHFSFPFLVHYRIPGDTPIGTGDLDLDIEDLQGTLDFHICNCIEKLGAANRTNVVAVALGKT